MKNKIRKKFFASTLLSVIAAACSATTSFAAGPVLPGAGTLIQEVQPQLPQNPSTDDTGLTLQPGKTQQSESDVAFEVKQIVIEGNTQIDTGTLHDLVRTDEGKSLTLKQLQKDAQRVTEFYRKQGYPLSRAIIPAQTLDSGQVKILVIEATYGSFFLNNTSHASNSSINSLLSPLLSGDPIADSSLDRALLLLSDMPGIIPAASMSPGSHTGSSDLTVNVLPGPRTSGSLTVNNYGNNFTGNGQFGANLMVNELLGIGDQLSANGLTTGPGMNYARLGYEFLANGSGTRVGASVSNLQYMLSDSMSALQGQGTASVTSAWARQPFIRSQTVNLYGQAEFDYKRLSDQTITTLTNRHLDNGVLSLNGDERDGWLSGGVGLMNASWTGGRVNFDNTQALSVDAHGGLTAGTFGKWTGNMNRLQNLGGERAQLYLSLSGQWAQKNLDPIEKLVVGGPYSVRGYDMGVMAADSGVLGTVEGRYKMTEHWQAVVFGDSEHIAINANPYMPGPNGATLSGAGVGANWTDGGAWSAKIYAASRLGAVPTQLAGSPAGTLLWGEVNWGF
ncbi:ShlB/FhaC/HecB family hemolysin secretion/activation protein [Ferrovum myxofaciens]|uniref:ShlB/FhaC/HecB family hemolysin secretion/activation protein n=1 Tax=Ferrovum myxofaciens TaxID=416213 RepID=A0A9E6SXR9_9PROT|nr:ShlB/FhaC/HecB family hemolysin secretion/activation protein [Ferrovum myxofaciens]QKE37343.1 MAG: ShlB/FhaC/HecB family hemolysin secretion/activation protein [Ferrovum myxofaciens]QWY74992.1 MAG: ShlB/FhaC/HecB family hemolysin secretion/activation protein [Ferrovum myxofaciens]QWY77738.1 MAG: ShlB/FhaC/HecB family hemolysin secretion/activation protein [Ferrovum myxofaciens]